MAAVTTMIVSGPLCADAADCRLLGSALFGEELAAGDAAGLRIGVVDDAVSEDVAPEVREACEAAIEALRDETGGEVREIELADLEASALAAVLIANAEGLGGVHAASGSTSSSPELSPINRGFAKYRMLLPAAAVGQVGAGAHGDAPAPGGALRGRRRDRLADGPGGRAAARGAAGRAPLGHADRRPGQRARRRPRQPDRDPGDQRPGRPRAATGCRSACSCRPPGGATSCCSTPPRRSSGPTAGAGSSRCRRSPPSRPRPECRRSSSRGWSAPSARCRPCRASTSRSPRARSTASSAPTGPARRRPCGC